MIKGKSETGEGGGTYETRSSEFCRQKNDGDFTMRSLPEIYESKMALNQAV